ncbi:MAG: cytochrome c [Candidatus Scalindua sp.]|nr:cytochrome c [Candidatus Scalindua sp.]
MKRRSNVYIILIVFMLFIQQIISGCATTVTKDVQKEELIREVPHKEELAKEELHKEEADPDGQKLYKDKCFPCHELSDIDAYGYTPQQWVIIIDNMHDPMKYSEVITSEEDAKIKDYLKNMSQK